MSECQLNRQQPVKVIQSDQKLNSLLARLWQTYFGTFMEFYTSTILRNAKLSIVYSLDLAPSDYRKSIEKLKKRWNERITFEGEYFQE